MKLCSFLTCKVGTMVLIPDVHSERDTHVWRNTEKIAIDWNKFLKLSILQILLHMCAPISELPSNINTMGVSEWNTFVLFTSLVSVSMSLCLTVPIVVGNSEIGVHVRSNLCYLIGLRHFIRSRVTILYKYHDTVYFAKK